MAGNCRFAFAVHILSVLAYHREGVNSELLASSVNTNPVVVRRLIAALRDAGLIVTQKGSGGGARLAREPELIPLDAVYRATEPEPRFSLHPQQPNQRCPIGRKIEEVLTHVFSAAQDALQAELAGRTIADVLESVSAEESPAAPSVRRRRRA